MKSAASNKHSRLGRPLRALEEVVVTTILVAALLLPVVHFFPGISSDSVDAIDVPDLHCATDLDVEACDLARETKDWAAGVVAWKYSTQTDVKIDAAYQCLWTGAIAQRLGYNRAMVVITAHERSEDQSEQQLQMDLANSAVGATIGELSNESSRSDKWGWIMSECEAKAFAKELYGPGGEVGAY